MLKPKPRRELATRSIVFYADQLERIEEIGEKYNRTRSELIRELMDDLIAKESKKAANA